MAERESKLVPTVVGCANGTGAPLLALQKVDATFESSDIITAAICGKQWPHASRAELQEAKMTTEAAKGYMQLRSQKLRRMKVDCVGPVLRITKPDGKGPQFRRFMFHGLERKHDVKIFKEVLLCLAEAIEAGEVSSEEIERISQLLDKLEASFGRKQIVKVEEKTPKVKEGANIEEGNANVMEESIKVDEDIIKAKEECADDMEESIKAEEGIIKAKEEIVEAMEGSVKVEEEIVNVMVECVYLEVDLSVTKM